MYVKDVRRRLKYTIRVVMLFDRSSKNNKNEAIVSFHVHGDKMTQLNYIVDSNTKYLNYMTL